MAMKEQIIMAKWIKKENNNKLIIGINAYVLDEHDTGLCVYIFQLINNLANIYQSDNKYDSTVFSANHYMLNKNIRIKKKLPSLFLSSRYARIYSLIKKDLLPINN